MPLVSGSPIVDARDSYTYFVSIFTEDGNIGTSLKLHVGLHLAAKQIYVMKFTSFVSQYVDFPFWVKKTVFNAALLSSILY